MMMTLPSLPTGLIPLTVEATVYMNYGGANQREYPSMPAPFGKSWIGEYHYYAELIYLEEREEKDPTLCDSTSQNSDKHSMFLLPSSSTRTFALLLAMGDCSMAHQALAAEAMASSVQYLIAYDPHEGDKDLIPSLHSSIEFRTELRILSVSYNTARTFIEYLQVRGKRLLQSQAIVLDSGSPSSRDPTHPHSSLGDGAEDYTDDGISQPSRDPTHPHSSLGDVAEDYTDDGISQHSQVFGYYQDDTVFGGFEDYDDVMSPNLGLFFTVMLLSSVFFLCAAAVQQRHIRYHMISSTAGRQHRQDDDEDNMLMTNDEPFSSMSPPPTSDCQVVRYVLTPEEVDRYVVTIHPPEKDVDTKHKDSAGGLPTLTTSTSTLMSEEEEKADEQGDYGNDDEEELDPSSLSSISTNTQQLCAICLEEIGEGAETVTMAKIQLPCSHVFHKDCVLPWLTERSGTCPLCKYDVYQYVQETSALDFSLVPTMVQNWLSSARRHVGSMVLFMSSPSTFSAMIEEASSAVDHHQATTTPVELEMAESFSSSSPSSATEEQIRFSPTQF